MNQLWYLPIFILFYMSSWFLVSLKSKRYDVIDVAWGPGFIMIVLLSFYFRELGLDLRSLFIIILIILWGLRLFFHTFHRNMKQGEDWRYHEWHNDSSCKYLLCTFFQVFIFQGALMMIVSLPLAYSLSLTFLPMYDINYLGVILASLGLVLETVADLQRSNFLNIEINKDKLMTSGLWRFSRHPNYLGEIVFWWGIYFLIWGLANSWMLIIAPLTISYMLIFVSGLPTEKKYHGRKDYIEYKRKTSPLLLWFPKK